jgi:hypothetical protein
MRAVDQQWHQIKGSAAVPVAVLDTGIAFHPELSGRTIPGYNPISAGQLKAIQSVSNADIIMVAAAGNRCTDEGGGENECDPAATGLAR